MEFNSKANNKNENEGKSGISSTSGTMGVESQIVTATSSSSSSSAPAWHLVLVAGIACGIQFGWALQLSLLTPYVQLLGIPHDTAPIIWLCGPISGMLVQPFVGFYSDNCNSRFGRRRPFIAAGAALVVVAVFLIGFAADIGHSSGDPVGNVKKPRAIGVFIVGFAILDVANNMLQVIIFRFWILSKTEEKKIWEKNLLTVILIYRVLVELCYQISAAEMHGKPDYHTLVFHFSWR